MKLFRNKYKRRAALGTILVHLIAIFIFYSFGLKYMDPKIEEGIAIEFGYVEEGMGEETRTNEVPSSTSFPPSFLLFLSFLPLFTSTDLL